MVAAPFSMIRLPTDRRAGERDHVDLGRQRQFLADEVVGRGDDVDDTGWDVGLLGDEPTQPGGVERRVGRGLEHHGVTGRQGLPELVDGDLEREVPRRDGADHPDRLVPHLSRGVHPGDGDDGIAEIRFPRKGFDQPRRVSESVFQRCVQLRPVGHRPWCTNLADELLAQLLHFDRRSPRAAVRDTACAVGGWWTSRFRRMTGGRRRWPGACPPSRRRRPRRVRLRWPD